MWYLHTQLLQNVKTVGGINAMNNSIQPAFVTRCLVSQQHIQSACETIIKYFLYQIISMPSYQWEL